MPLVYQQNINLNTRLGVWHIQEVADYFLQKVPAQRFISHPHKQLQHLAGRYLLQALYPDFPYELLAIADTRKPFLINEAYHFSISHCGDYAAVIMSPQLRVGIDIETITSKTSLLQGKFLTPEEQFQLHQWQPIYPAATLHTVCWSIKEALFKWYGAGKVDFRQHLRIHQISFDQQQGIAHCFFQKETPVPLTVYFLLFGAHCIAWVFNQ